MAIRVYKPTSPARRFMSVLTFEEVTKTTPEKSLLESKKKNAGRNKQGKITVRHQVFQNLVVATIPFSVPSLMVKSQVKLQQVQKMPK